MGETVLEKISDIEALRRAFKKFLKSARDLEWDDNEIAAFLQVQCFKLEPHE